ncbi:pectin acetylesterase 8-like isoform X3 [Salvia miltiorrhiza]|uniref:pectin acetylesterase 8-like isoform X3 n=1 Tax=Salvia miltiorrhiza TaxID=226208 RepID=UPI0025ACBCC0|nr:pectin acetylesterase 8-like isoform X3 [Salvia miltiorrhiza]
MAKGSITIDGWLSLLICSLVMNAQVHGDTLAPVTILDSAIPKGAVCLDGSAPAYSYAEGSGDGADSWIVYLQGGGWCYNLTDCYSRSRTYLGSSHFIASQTNFSALLDLNCTSNPDFCNWHKVYITYCDGSSFMSDILDSKTNLSFRGARIFNVMMEEMLAKGMRNAKQAILTGSSAGGLATMLHCDKFRKLFSNATRVKCISDSGFFLHGKGLRGIQFREYFYGYVIKTHELANSLPLTCTSKRNPNLCLFPEYFAGDIETPLFILESAFDQFQLGSVVGSHSFSCLNNLMSCNSTELGLMRDFRRTLIETLVELKNSSNRGMFVHSCYLHPHFNSQGWWTNISLANKTIGKAIGDWYYDRSSIREVDTQNDSPRNCTNILSPKSLHMKSLATLPHNRLKFIFFLCFLVV